MAHDPSITKAWLRGGAGPMRDRRAPRGGARNESADLLAEALEELQEAAEEAPDGTLVVPADRWLTFPVERIVRGERRDDLETTADWLRACGLNLDEE